MLKTERMCSSSTFNIYSLNIFPFCPSYLFLSFHHLSTLIFSAARYIIFSLLVFQSDWRCNQQLFLINRQHCLLGNFALSPLNVIKKSAAFINGAILYLNTEFRLSNSVCRLGKVKSEIKALNTGEGGRNAGKKQVRKIWKEKARKKKKRS